MRTHKTAQVPYEKYNRDNILGPKADDKVSIQEKNLPHRQKKELEKTTEDQMTSKRSQSSASQVVEKELNSAKSPYVTHRDEIQDLKIPAINALVEQIRQKRLAEDFKTDKKPHWSQTFNEQKQQGALPKFPKNAPQHTKPVLGNDPNRFSSVSDDPTESSQNKIKPLVGNITTADVDKIAHGIKTAASTDHNTAIMAILRLAHDERRELTNVEKKTIVNLKLARNEMLLKC